MKIIRGEREKNSCFVESNFGLLLFDTGASSSQILRSPLTDKLIKKGTTTSHGLVGSINQPEVVIDRLTAGEMTVEHLNVTIDNHIGILGNDVLKNYAFIFDMKKNEITIVERFTSDIPAFIGEKNYLYVPIKIHGKEYGALIDTGASCSLMDRSSYIHLFGEIPERKIEQGRDWTNTPIETPMAILDGLTIGDTLFPKQEIALLDFSQFSMLGKEYPFIMIIGAGTLQEKRFWFNMVDGYIKVE